LGGERTKRETGERKSYTPRGKTAGKKRKIALERGHSGKNSRALPSLSKDNIRVKTKKGKRQKKQNIQRFKVRQKMGKKGGGGRSGKSSPSWGNAKRGGVTLEEKTLGRGHLIQKCQNLRVFSGRVGSNPRPKRGKEKRNIEWLETNWGN